MSRVDDVALSTELATAIRQEDSQRRLVAESLARGHATLPLRYWRQQAHFTTPAADLPMARKAIEGGTASMTRILERFGVSGVELAERLEVDRSAVEDMLEHPRRAPLVMLDGEDAQALRDDVVEQGLTNTAALLQDADWSGDHGPTLRFFRPPGFDLETSVRDLYTLLWRVAGDDAGATSGARQLTRPSLDGIVFPKVEHPDEIDLLYGILDRAEVRLGLEPRSIRVGLLIESGGAVSQLAEIGARAAPRLCSLIFGIADFSADLGLPAIVNDHSVADWARAEIVAVAGAVGVPAIDGMTLAYPVADPDLSPEANCDRFLDRMAAVHDDALRAREFGMLGKWVGHPAQLFGVLLAFESDLGDDRVEREAAKLEAYAASVDGGRGATIIGGAMSDRATDRHARVFLRRATALGRFDPVRAASLGAIGEDEIAEARAMSSGSAAGGW